MSGTRKPTGAVLAAMVTGLAMISAWAQSREPVPLPAAQPSLQLHMLLEKTIFQVDVLTLDLWLGPATARRLQEVLAGKPGLAAGDSVAHVSTYSRDAWARITFLRGVGLESFLDGIVNNMQRAWRTGILTQSDFDMISRGLPQWFTPLREREIHAGDRLFYRIRGDTLRTVFQTTDGEILIDQTDVGPERRLSVLGSFLVEGSDFRAGLLRSLEHPETR